MTSCVGRPAWSECMSPAKSTVLELQVHLDDRRKTEMLSVSCQSSSCT